MLAAFNVTMAFCKAMVKGRQDPKGSYATAQEICKQFISLGENALGTILQRMNYIGELLSRSTLPSFKDFQKFLNEVVHIINCDAKPFVPKGLRVAEHIKGGKIEWDPSKIVLYTSNDQKNRRCIEGNELRKELEGQPVLNANVLDCLLAYPELISKEWEGECIFFWGTIYRDTNGNLVVRYLHLYSNGWGWGFCLINGSWGGDLPAALYVNT